MGISIENRVTSGMKFGCLQILDDGSEFLQIIDERIANIQDEKDRFIKDVEADKYVRRDHYSKRETIPAYIYKPKNFKIYGDSVTFSDFDKAIEEVAADKEVKHYKCKCKCGKVRYYTEKTLIREPKFCYKQKREHFEKILLEEGMKIILKKLDVQNLFKKIYKDDPNIDEKNAESEYIEMSNNCKKELRNVLDGQVRTLII